MRPIAIFIFLLFTGQAADVFAEPPSLQIPAGKSIRIYTRDAETRLTGRFQQAIKDSLIMTRARGILGRKQRLSIALADISKLEVHLYHESHVKKGGIRKPFVGCIRLSRVNKSKGHFCICLIPPVAKPCFGYNHRRFFGCSCSLTSEAGYAVAGEGTLTTAITKR